MLRKMISLLICFIMIISLPVTAKADIGPKPSVRIHIVAEWCCYRWLLNQEHLYYVLLYLDLERKHVSQCSAKIYLQNHGMSPLALRTLSLHLWRGGLVAQETRLLLWSSCQPNSIIMQGDLSESHGCVNEHDGRQTAYWYQGLFLSGVLDSIWNRMY